MKKKLLNWFLVLLWLILIFWFSHQPNLSTNLIFIWDFLLRKAAHMAEYFVLTYLLIKALENHKVGFKRLLQLALGLSVLAAVFDEWHQSFVIGRHSSFIDVIIDSFGAGLVIILKLRNKYGSLFSRHKI